MISVTSSAGSAARNVWVSSDGRGHAHRCPGRADVPARRHDGRNGEGTTVINSFSSTIQPETTPAPTSVYRLLQKPGGQDLGVPVRFVHSGHSEGNQDVGPRPIGAFSFAFPFVAGTTRIEFVKRNASGRRRPLCREPDSCSEIDGVEVSGGSGPITFLQQRGAPQRSTTPKETAGGLATAASSSDPPGTAPPGDVGIAAAGAGTGLSTTYVFTGNGGYSADGLGQNVTGGTIQAEVPTGSTVKKAFLYGTYFGGQIPPTRSARSTSTEPGS